jgi:hypothetical protein
MAIAGFKRTIKPGLTEENKKEHLEFGSNYKYWTIKD